MKKLILGLFAILTISVAAQAQEKTGGKHSGRKHHKQEMAQKLNFSEEQKTQLKTIHEESRKQLEELKKDDKITVKEYNERKKIIHDQRHSKMQALLTPDQKTKMEQFKKERKDKFKGKGKDKAAKEKVTTL